MPQIQITLIRVIGSIESSLRIFAEHMKGMPPEHMKISVEMLVEKDFPGWQIHEYHSV